MINTESIYQYDEQKIHIKRIISQDNKKYFYSHMGQFFASKEIANELGNSIYNNDNYMWWVAFNELKEVIGFCAAESNEKNIILKHAYIIPLYRGIGLYAELLNIRLEYLKKEGKTLKITVKSTIAHKLQKQGFQKKGQRGQYTLMQLNP